MRYHITDDKPIPNLIKTKDWFKNAWISPKGDFYGFSGAKHLVAASYIAIMVLGKDESVLNHGKFFKETFDGYLSKNKWIEIKDTSWLDDIDKVTIIGEPNQKQLDVIFDYRMHFGWFDQMEGNLCKT